MIRRVLRRKLAGGTSVDAVFVAKTLAPQRSQLTPRPTRYRPEDEEFAFRFNHDDTTGRRRDLTADERG